MGSRRSDLSRLRRQFRTDHRLVLEAAVLLAFARLAILTVPFRWTIKLLAFEPCNKAAQAPVFEMPASQVFSRRAHRALSVVSACVPWKSTCLTLALAGAAMLRLRRLPGTLFLGVTRSSEKAGSMEAHAWLSAGGIIISGGADHKKYHLIAIYSHIIYVP